MTWFRSGSAWRWAAFAAVALLGLALRLPQLGARPMHTDEAVNAYIVGEVLAGNSFPYDAADRHGPVLAAVAVPLARAQGAKSFAELDEVKLRLTTVLAGTLTLVLFGAAVEMFGFVPCLVGAVLTAACALPVYYDRYFIHEPLLVCATFGLMLSGWRLWMRGGISNALVVGGCAAVMMAAKETAVIHFAGIGMGAAWVWWRQRDAEGVRGWWMWSVAGGVFLGLSLVLFSWFGTELNVVGALKQAGPAYFARAHGAGHEKVFSYYGRLIAGNASGLIACVLGVAGVWRTVSRRGRIGFEFLAVYAFAVGLIYSSIPYKTPWLALNLWLPLTLFAGLGVDALWRVVEKPALKVGVLVALVGGAAVLVARDTRRLVFAQAADEANPFAYAHTSVDLLGLGPAIDRLAAEQRIAAPRIAVIAKDAWPLPWYLRRYAGTGFWQPGAAIPQADFYVTTTAEAFDGEAMGLRAEFFGLRPGVLVLLWSRSSR